MSKRIRVLQSGLREGLVRLGEEATHYALRVHRLRAGDALVLVDPWQGTEADAELVRAGSNAEVRVAAPRGGERRGLPLLQLVQGLGKGDKLDRVVKDAVALGAGRLWVVETARSVPRGHEPSDPRTQRWESIALDTVRQSERAELPSISGPTTPQAVIEQTPHAFRVVLQPAAGAQSLWRVLTQSAPSSLVQPRPLQLWVGPEGGFSEAELGLLRAAGAVFADLGPLILRTEIAASAALALASAWLREASAAEGGLSE